MIDGNISRPQDTSGRLTRLFMSSLRSITNPPQIHSAHYLGHLLLSYSRVVAVQNTATDNMKLRALIIALLATPAAALQGGYLSQMGGGNTLKPSSIKPVGAVSPAFGGSYLDRMAKSAPAVVSAPSVASTQSNVAPLSTGYPYLDDIVAISKMSAPQTNGAAAVGAAWSMSEMLNDFTSPIAAGDYLSSLKVSAVTGGTGPAGYLDTLRIQAAATAATNLPGYLDTLRVASAPTGTGPLTYLDNIAGATRVTAKVEATTAVTLTSNEPILAAINRMNENMKKNQKTTIEILQDINVSVRKLVIRAAKAPAAPPAQTTELVAALESSATPTAAGYLSSLKVQSAGAPSGRGIGGYLNSL
jgi:hypothetical protein